MLVLLPDRVAGDAIGGKGRRSGITLPPFTLNGEGGPPWGVLVLPELKPGVLLITHYSAITRAQTSCQHQCQLVCLYTERTGTGFRVPRKLCVCMPVRVCVCVCVSE